MVEQNTKLIAYCGLYCDDCPLHKEEGNIPDMARDLRKALRQYKFEIAVQEIPFKEFKFYKECYECLGALVKIRCKKGCRNGGGNPFCKIRKCCVKNSYQGCWECAEFEACEKLKGVTTIHKNAIVLNLKNLKKDGIEEFLKGKRYF